MLLLLIYLPLLFLMIWGGITVRKERGGFGSFGDAFLAVFIISLTATFIFDTFGYVLYKVIDPGLTAFIKEKSIENTTAIMEKFGAPEEQIEQATKKMEDQDFTLTIKSELMHYAGQIAVGAILSLLIALFVRRGDEQPVIKAEG